jgi:hypothetical protein
MVSACTELDEMHARLPTCGKLPSSYCVGLGRVLGMRGFLRQVRAWGAIHTLTSGNTVVGQIVSTSSWQITWGPNAPSNRKHVQRVDLRS